MSENPITETVEDVVDSLQERLSRLDRFIEAAPEGPPDRPDGSPGRRIDSWTGVPARYRDEWPIPDDPGWRDLFGRARGRVGAGGILALIGPRGTGKTRLACEIVRDRAPTKAHYTTAMGLFLRIRATFRKGAAESEQDVVDEIARVRLLVLDEVQERGNTEWEDRILTHIIDRRYGAMRPTILIANLTRENLEDSIGESIADRIREDGGVLVMNGSSHRGI